MANASFSPDLNNVLERHFSGISKTKKKRGKRRTCQPLSASASGSHPAEPAGTSAPFQQHVQGEGSAAGGRPAREGTHSPGMDGGQEENELRTIGFLMDTHLLCHRSSDFGAPQI